MSRLARLGFLLATSAFAIAGCGGSAESTGVVAGSACTPIGAHAAAADGCNTCACTDHGWACTDVACGGCTNGDTKPAADGCNTCSCVGGRWACTAKACPVPECPAPASSPSNIACTQAVVYARSPLNGTCCMYGDQCAAPEGWQTYSTQLDCEGATCTPGATKPASDTCNTCTCTATGWTCTTLDCTAPCVDGQTKTAANGLCTCWAGRWLCTGGDPIGCGGFAGATCAADEYCAYVAGQMCGAADASAACMPRPSACDTVYAPVCGCDGKPYGNACEAAAAGTGVNAVGGCPPAP